MDELLKNINPDFNKLRRYIIQSAAQELSGLSAPCYYPKTKKIYHEFLNILGIKDVDFKKFVKRNYKGTKAETWSLINDLGTNMFIVVMHLLLIKKDNTAYSTAMVYYIIFHYSKLMHKHIKYCDPDTFKYTLDTLTKTHLFAREKTIPGSLYYLSSQVQRVYTNDIKEWNVERISDFIQASRHRISQSIRSFSESYYRNKKEGRTIKTQIDYTEDSEGNINVYQTQVQQKGKRVIEDVIKKLTIYKFIDIKALEEAKTIVKIQSQLAMLIVTEIRDVKYSNDINILLNLFLKEVKSIDMLCGDEFYTLVKKLMALKRSIAQIYFKAQVSNITKNVIQELDMTDQYNSYTPQTQFIINSFLAFYLTLLVKNNTC